MDGGFDGAGQRHGIGCRADHEVGKAERRLEVVDENDRLRRGLKLGLARVADHAHDLHRILDTPAELQFLPDRVAPRKVLPHELLVDDDRARRADAVAGVEVPARDERHAHRLKISGADVEIAGAGRPDVRRRLSSAVETRARNSLLERQEVRRPDLLYARNGANLGKQPGEVGRLLSGLAVPGRRGDHVHCQQAGSLESGVDRGQAMKAPQHQSRAGQQHERHRDLHHDQARDGRRSAM